MSELKVTRLAPVAVSTNASMLISDGAGARVGNDVDGGRVVGFWLGGSEGDLLVDGDKLGLEDGGMDGPVLGPEEGIWLGAVDGLELWEGPLVGCRDGRVLGVAEGLLEGL